MRAILLILVCTLLLPAHARDLIHVDARTDNKGVPSVHKVDFSEAPELMELAGRARQLGDELYPKILTLLTDNASKLPRQFNIFLSFKKQLGMDYGGILMDGTNIYLNADFLMKYPTNLEVVLIHEMAHVAQQYPGNEPSYWMEGFADYVCFKLGYTSNWMCPTCDVHYPHYTSGYQCTGAFLSYLDAMYGSDVVCQLSVALCRRSYSEKFFVKATGKRLNELWLEFQKTPAFKPIAVQAYELQQALGYRDGQPPKDVQSRAMTYIRRQPGGALTLAAQAFLKDLLTQGDLPGFGKGEHGSVNYDWKMLIEMRTNSNREAYPVSRTLAATKDGDTSSYHYTFVRASRNGDWKLHQAWRTDQGGHTIEEYPVP